MNYFDIKAKLEVILSKKKVSLTILVMLLVVIMYGVRLLGMIFSTGNSVMDYAISFVWSVLGIFLSNTIYFCILKHVREEKFGMAEVRFSFSHLPIQIVLGLVYTVARFFIDSAVSVFGMMIPVVYLVLNLCLVILYFSVESSLAFCIYDGGVNVMEIAKGVFHFVKAKARILLRCGFPYLVSYYLYIICIASVLSGAIQMNGEMLDLEKTVNFLAANPLSGTVLSMLGLSLLFWVVFAYFELRVFSATALLYDENKPLFFSRMKSKI